MKNLALTFLMILVGAFSLILSPTHSSATPLLSGTTTFDFGVTVQFQVFAPGVQSNSIFDTGDNLFDILGSNSIPTDNANTYFFKLTNTNPDITITKLKIPKAQDALITAGEITSGSVDTSGTTIGIDIIKFDAPLPPDGMRIFFVASPSNPIMAGNAFIGYDGITFWNTWSLGNNGVLPAPLAVPSPEPGTLFLLGSGLVGLIGFGRKWTRRLG